MVGDRSDSELITASLRDPRAFAPVFERHFAAVHGYLARRGGRMQADELAGEVFRIAFERRDRYDDAYQDARPWLFGIATRLWWRAVRQAERSRRAYERAAVSANLVEHALDEVDDRVDAAVSRARLGDAIERLAPGDRDALLLFAWEAMTYADIARALEIPIGTVRSRIHRARARMRELLCMSGQLPCDQTTRR